MRILLAYPSINTQLRFNAGLGILSSILKEEGFDVSLFIIKNKKDIPNLIKKIKNYNPQVIGFSSNSNYWNLVNSISAILKSNSDIPIFAGGMHPSISPDCLINSNVDGVCLGEGEKSFLELLKKIRDKKDHTKTIGFWFKKNNKIIKNKLASPIQDLDILPFPDRALFPEKVIKSYCNFLLSRGCAFNCSYCCNNSIKGRYFKNCNYIRYRSVDNCIKEIEQVVSKYNPKLIVFDDDCLNKNIGWFREFCKKYKEKIELPFICNTRVELFNSELAKLYKSANCSSISFGVETGDEKLRKDILLRSMSDKLIIKAFQTAKKVGLKTHSFNMVGLPGETKEKFMKTVRLNQIIKPDNMQISIFYPYPGTKLGDLCIKKGFIKGEGYNHFDKAVVDYPAFSSKTIEWCADNFHFLVYQTDSLTRAYIEKIRNRLFMHDTALLKAIRMIATPIYKFVYCR